MDLKRPNKAPRRSRSLRTLELAIAAWETEKSDALLRMERKGLFSAQQREEKDGRCGRGWNLEKTRTENVGERGQDGFVRARTLQAFQRDSFLPFIDGETGTQKGKTTHARSFISQNGTPVRHEVALLSLPGC